MDTSQLHVAIALGVTAVGAAFDVASRKIPNVVSFGGMLAGIALNSWSGFTFAGAGGAARSLGLSLLGILLSAFVPLVFFIRGEMGGGDVKLLAAIGAFVGPLIGFQVLAYTYAVLLAFLPIRVFMSGRVRVLVRNTREGLLNLFRSRDSRIETSPFRLPSMIMGPSIFVGFALCAWFNWRLL